MLLEEEIPAGRSALLDSFTNLERVAEYCESNYVQVITKCFAMKENFIRKKHSQQAICEVIWLVRASYLPSSANDSGSKCQCNIAILRFVSHTECQHTASITTQIPGHFTQTVCQLSVVITITVFLQSNRKNKIASNTLAHQQQPGIRARQLQRKTARLSLCW